MFYLFLLLISVISIAAYVLFIFRVVPGAAEQRLGVLEPLPDNLGTWVKDELSAQGAAARDEGLVREVRHIYSEGQGMFGGGKLLRQVRYRSQDGGAIVRVEPEQHIKRRRIKPE